MSTESIQIMVAVCPDTTTAETKLKALQHARNEQGVELTDAAIVWRDEQNKLHVHETTDVTSGRGAAVGGVLGGVLGLIAGPGGIVAGAAVGAIIGGAAARAFDSGIPHKRLEAIGNNLKPGNVALVILTKAGFTAFIESLIQGPGIEIVTESLNPQDAEQLAHDHAVALKALGLGESLADGGMASATKDKTT